MQKKENKKIKLIILMVLVLLIFWLSKSFCDEFTNSRKMLNSYLYPFFKTYFYLIIFVIIFEIIRYFIKLKLKIKNNTIKLLINVIVFVGILFLVSGDLLLFFSSIIFVIFFLCLQLIFNIKELCILLLIVFPITFSAPFFYYNNYYLEYFYKEKNMKISTKEMTISNKLPPIERNIACSNHVPSNCKFIRSSDIGLFGGWCEPDGTCSGGFMIECVYMCPK